ncbi:MAG: hypothetical protein U0269_18755 [Polyangiales bacterium]
MTTRGARSKRGAKSARPKTSASVTAKRKPARSTASEEQRAEAPRAPTPDAKLRAKYQALKDEMSAALRGEMRGWDQYWEAVAKIIAERWYLFDGFKNAAEWVGATLDVPLRTALRNTRIATVASPDEEAKYTPTKIDLALSLLDAQAASAKKLDGRGPEEARGAVDFAALRYEVTRDDHKRTVTLAEVTTDELRALLRKTARKGKVTERRLGPTAQALADLLAEHETLSELALSERDGLIVLGGFRADQLGELGRVLLAVKAGDRPKRRG